MLDKMKTLKDVSKQVKSKMAENKEIDKNLREIQVAVAERAQIEKLAGKKLCIIQRGDSLGMACRKPGLDLFLIFDLLIEKQFCMLISVF